MKKQILISLLVLIIIKSSPAQLLCVQAFEQNDSIGVNVGSNNLILNGGFENTSCAISSVSCHSFCPNSQYYDCNIANWSCTGGGDSTYSSLQNSSLTKIIQGNKDFYFGNYYASACSGIPSSSNNDTSCFNYSGCIVSGIPIGYPFNKSFFGGATGVSLSQTVIGLIPGNYYVLEFWAGGEDAILLSNHTYPNKGLFAVDIGFGNIFLRNNPTPVNVGIGTRYILQFKATSSSPTIKFTNWGHVCGSCTELNLDDVRLYSNQYLPETISHCDAGITDLTNENEILISPNPATTSIIITSSTNIKEIKLINLLGEEVLITNYQLRIMNAVSVDVSSVAKGIYFVEVTDDRKTIANRKIVVQ